MPLLLLLCFCCPDVAHFLFQHYWDTSVCVHVLFVFLQANKCILILIRVYYTGTLLISHGLLFCSLLCRSTFSLPHYHPTFQSHYFHNSHEYPLKPTLCMGAIVPFVASLKHPVPRKMDFLRYCHRITIYYSHDFL